MQGTYRRGTFSADLGFVPPLLALLLAEQALFNPALVMGHLVAFEDPFLRVDAWLVFALGFSYSVWIALVCFARLPTWTGHGFVVAGFGATGRAWADLARLWLAGTPDPVLDAGATVCLVAYGVGVGMVAASAALELRTRTRVPPLRLRDGVWRQTKAETFR